MSTNDSIDKGREPAEAEPTCRCGHGLGHHMVSIKHDYSAYAIFWLFVGASAKPRKIRWMCRRCGDTLRESTDPAELERHY